MNLQETFCTHVHYVPLASTDVKILTLFEKNGGMRLWIMKWTFEVSYLEISYFIMEDIHAWLTPGLINLGKNS